MLHYVLSHFCRVIPSALNDTNVTQVIQHKSLHNYTLIIHICIMGILVIPSVVAYLQYTWERIFLTPDPSLAIFCI